MFVLGDDGKLIGLSEKAYDSEDLLQSLLASYPDLLAGEEMAPGAPRRWLLVSRETGVPDAAEAAARWSVDHLFLDQDGVPTLVEVKRSTDTRIRREVVGQMLDYAANAVVYLPVEVIRSTFEARCASGGFAPESVLAGAFGDTIDGEAFWGAVKTNLEAGRIRLVFVADLIPAELRRIIEYLNGQMNPTEVYGVEIKQYVGGGLRTLVPRLIGRTADADRAKSSGGSVRGETWTAGRFDEELARRRGAETVHRAHRILEWAARRNLRVWWGQGLKIGGFVPIFDAPDGVSHQLFEVWTGGEFEVFFQYLGAKGPFVDEAMRLELRQRLNAIPGISIPADAIARRPSFRLNALADEGAVDRVLEVFDWVLAEIEKAS